MARHQCLIRTSHGVARDGVKTIQPWVILWLMIGYPIIGRYQELANGLLVDFVHLGNHRAVLGCLPDPKIGAIDFASWLVLLKQ